jgi:signal transduction histidine kinase
LYTDEKEIRDLWLSGKIKTIATDKEKQVSEISLTKRDGTQVSIEQRFHSFTQNEKTYYYVFIRDITERKKSEEMIERAIGIMHHDLRSPLNSISGFSSPDLVADASHEDLIFYMSLIQESSTRMLRMIEFYLMFNRLKRGENDIQKKKTSLFTFLDKVKSEFFHFGRALRVDLRVILDSKNIPDTSSIEINIERTIFQPLIMNLLRNAAEAAPEGKKEITLKISWDNDKIFFTVHNYGEVPVEIRGQLFQEHVTAGKKSGSGIGLYSAKLAAEAHEGNIQYLPEDGGTNFIVSIPL